MRYNNNPKNRRALVEFQKRQLELANRTEEEARKRRIAGNLEAWSDKLPDSLKMAKAQTLHSLTIKRIQNALKNAKDKHIIITGSESAYPVYVVHTILYELIKMGMVTPSEIRKTSALDGYNNINGMYESRLWKEHIFDNKAKVVVIEGSSRGLIRLGNRGEDQFWRELIEDAKVYNKLIIITYTLDESEMEQEIPIPTLTSEMELNNSIVKNSSFIQLSDEEERKIKHEQEKSYRSI